MAVSPAHIVAKGLQGVEAQGQAGRLLCRGYDIRGPGAQSTPSETLRLLRFHYLFEQSQPAHSNLLLGAARTRNDRVARGNRFRGACTNVENWTEST